ncbi:MAG: AlpA family phage regulatory protein [Deltaproteobacteria bacterium]|nr:AlpA family phage regulatory protein [Deltaproteobacteria bacterium]
MANPQEKTEQILRPKDLTLMLGISRTSLWRLDRDDSFPKRVTLGARSIGWKLSEVESWLEQKQTA